MAHIITCYKCGMLHDSKAKCPKVQTNEERREQMQKYLKQLEEAERISRENPSDTLYASVQEGK